MLGQHDKATWVILGSIILIPPLLLAVFFCMAAFNVFHAHEHCIKQTGLAFKTYALDNYGRLPYDANGFGNALLLLVKSGYLGDTNGQHSINLITGPGDDGTVLREALKTGAHIPEQKCSRIYIQGLSETNNPNLAILWDKKSMRGGDHFRRSFLPSDLVSSRSANPMVRSVPARRPALGPSLRSLTSGISPGLSRPPPAPRGFAPVILRPPPALRNALAAPRSALNAQ
jgi:hypothetical protein